MVFWVEGQGRAGAPSKSLLCRCAGRGSGRARGGRAQRVGGGRPRSPGDWRVACVGTTPRTSGLSTEDPARLLLALSRGSRVGFPVAAHPHRVVGGPDPVCA